MNKFQFSIIIFFNLLIIFCNGQNEDIADNGNNEIADIGTNKCYHCQSDINLDCFENVENIENSNIDCLSDCATGIINKILYRNCRILFDSENIENFKICNTSLCNKEPVKNSSIVGEDEIPKNDPTSNEPVKIISSIEEYELPKTVPITEEPEIEDELSKTVPITEEPEIGIEESKIKCYKCKGSDENCLVITPKNELVDCSDDGCYTRKSENILKRGCTKDLSPVELENCTKKKSCNLCTESECNIEPWAICYSCRSSEDPNCSQWKQPENCPIEICDYSNDNCIIQIETQIETVRKCSRINETCPDNELCKTCTGNLCNTGVFPKNRQLCHQCSLTEDCGKEQLPNDMEVCINYNKNDGCFMFATSEPSFDVLMHRGCKSDIIKYSECQKSEADKKCLTCDHENGCNKQGARTKPQLWCSICGVDEQCAWAQPKDTLKKCTQEYWYTLKEKCFTYLNDNGTAERGCSFDRGVCIDDARRCKTCSKSGCNFGPALTQSCIQCNSSRPADIQCKKELKGIVGTKCNKNEMKFEEIGCYTKINSKNVIRGCAADLDSKELEKCKMNKSCYFCGEQNSDDFECYKCDSGNDEEINCAINPNDKLQKETCSATDKLECYVAIDDIGNTVRGCVTPDIPKNNKKCDTPLCNIEIFPDDRLKCFKCEGKDCVKPPKGNPEICKNYNEADKCYTNVIDEIDALRGCNSERNPEIPINNYVTCKDSGCNKENGIITLSCSDCNSNKDDDCIRTNTNPCNISNKNTCDVKYLLGHPIETCFTYHHFQNVIRGCTKNAAKLQLTPSKLRTCNGNLCNNKCLPLENCAICGENTKDDPNCSINKIKTCGLTHSACFTCLNKNNTGMVRGCGYPPPYMNCQFCQEESGCNTNPLHKCYKCNSENKLTCSGLPHAGTIETEICESSETQCLTIINHNNFTERGCESAKFNCKHNDTCVPCTGQFCNNDIIPPYRLKCHQCNSFECSVKPVEGNEEPCREYDLNEECLEFRLNTTNFVRGCKSDSEYFEKCEKIGIDCKKCQVEGCNRQIVFNKKPLLKCYKCNTLDPHCGWTQKFGDAESCTNIIDINAKEYCFSLKSKNGTLLRGCSLDMNICMEKNDECEICTETGCNKDVITPQYCIQNVVLDGKDKKLIKEKCQANEQFLDSEGCYVRRVNKTVTWGCAMDLPLINLAECKDIHFSQCNYCYGVNCDKMKAPKGNTASQLTVLSFVLIFTSFLVHSTF